MALPRGDVALLDGLPVWESDPLAFVKQSFDWGYGELAEYPGPDEWQADILKAIGDGTKNVAEALRIAVASGHGIGKSALVAWIILWAMSTRPHLAGVVTANTGTQLETKTWRELAIWHKRLVNAHWFEWTATKFYQVDHPETWFVSAIPWREEKSEAFAGLHSKHVLIIYDEASAVADVIWEVTEGATTTPGAIWCVFGNPTRNTGRFRECFGRFKHRWTTRQIDSRTAVMANGNQISQWIEDWGIDSDFVKVRVLGQFPSAGDKQFIGTEIIDAAVHRKPVKDSGAPLVLGVDVARFGSDQSVIYFRKGRDGQSEKPLKFRGIDTMQLAGKVALECDRHQPSAVFVDGNGVGGGVVDRLRQLGYPVHDVQAAGKPNDEKKYLNKRVESWARAREWLREGGSIYDDLELRADLAAPEYTFKSDKLVLESKDDMVKRGLSSPDVGDALALTFAEPVARTDMAFTAHRHQRVADANYDMYAT